MILSVHATFGAAVASLVPSHPVSAFCFGFVSHLVLDAIPHKDYELVSVDYDKTTRKMKPVTAVDIICKKFKLIRDLLLISFDALLGIILAFMFFFNPVHPWIFFIGAVGSLLPDFLTFLYLILKHKPLGLFYNFHGSFVHSQVVLKLNQITGVILQFFTIAILIAILFGIKHLLIT